MSRTGSWIVAAAAVAAAMAAAAPASAETKPNSSCFQLNQLQSTRPDGDMKIYARVGVNTFYRIDLAHRCTSLPYAWNHLVITPTGGTNLICGPLDFDLKVNDNGMLEPCFVKSITRLTPEEAAAIPKKAKP